jgi:hypothetical protein
MQQRPVSKELRIARDHLADPMPRTPSMPPQTFVFRHRPVRKAPVEVAKRRIKRRFVVTTVVVNPTPYDGIEHPCQVVNPPVHPTPQLPVTDFFPDRLESGQVI